MDNEFNTEIAGHLLHREKRDMKWEDVEEFYADKNNFAMYLVLPIIVIVYGGCAVIYCIARCRRYLRRKKRKSHRKQQLKENEPLNESSTPQIPSVPVLPVGSHRDGSSSSSEVRVSVERDSETPLPWQVPGAATNDNAYVNKGYQKDYAGKPPSYDETYKPIRPMSKPPPYEENGMRQRHGSVEEIITLDAPPLMQKNDLNDRKRLRPGSSRASLQQPGDEDGVYDAEREKARQLIRGDRPRRERTAGEKIDIQKTPDIISHARTQPLKPQYKPTLNDPKAEATLMAKQAANLLRLDHMGRQAGRKSKRLVFVTE